MSVRRVCRLLENQAGLSLAEVLVAVMIVMIPLLTLLSVLPVGLQATQVGRQKSTALFLADRKLEQIKAWAASTAGGQGFTSITNGTPSTAACCAAEAYGSIPTYGNYRRRVNISDGPSNTKLVQVQVFYRPIIPNGIGAETFVQVATYVAP